MKTYEVHIESVFCVDKGYWIKPRGKLLKCKSKGGRHAEKGEEILLEGQKSGPLSVHCTLMIPMQVIMIPVIMIASKNGIRNTLLGVIIPP